jgi:hypothetical protein
MVFLFVLESIRMHLYCPITLNAARPLLCAALYLVAGASAATFRADRVPLGGVWKFELRRDNQLCQTGPVRFGPVSASSQALFLEPWKGQSQEGRWRTSVPWPLSATLIASNHAGFVPPDRQIWRPHKDQPGATWWHADLGQSRTVAAVEVQWAQPGNVTATALTSEDGSHWQRWAEVGSTPATPRSLIEGPPRQARYVKIEFAPAQFAGTGRIDIYFAGRDGSRTAWQPVIQSAWFDELRRYAPRDGFEKASFNDAAWRDIQVPGYWEVQKFSEPTWWQPDETVGYYRRKFTVPEDWRGRGVRLRFEGVNNSAQVWVNGVEVGYHENGFTAFEYNVAPLVRFGAENTITVRAAKWSLTHDYDTDDMWFLGGIWRDVYLYSLPRTRIDDYTLKTEFDRGYRDATLSADLKLRADAPGRVELSGELRDAAGAAIAVHGFRATVDLAGGEQRVTLAGRVRAPRQWNAETPYLYTLTLRLAQGGRVEHEFSQRVGFRQVEVRGSDLLLNGKPIKIHGAVTTRANPNDSGEPSSVVFEREIRLLKQANINTIRSHTTPLEEEFLDLCDRYGIYIMPDVPYVWVREEDFRYLTDGAIERAQGIYAQHKNRTSVILWHIGNENGVTSSTLGMGRASRWLHAADPTRPVMNCSNNADVGEFGTTIHDDHYSPLTRRIFQSPTESPVLFGEFHALPEIIARLDDRGLVETWGRSLGLEWAEFERRPWVVGGLICCWDDGSVNGNIGPRQWGILDSKRRPKGVHSHIARAFSPLKITVEQPRWQAGSFDARMTLANRNSFTDLTGFRFHWQLRAGAVEVGAGETRHTLAPGAQASVPVQLTATSQPDRLVLTVYDAQGFDVVHREFRIPLPGVSSVGELLARVAQAAQSTSKFRLRSTQPGGISVYDAKGLELVAVHGLVVSHGSGWNANQPFTDAAYDAARATTQSVEIPVRIPSAGLSGELRAQLEGDGVRFSYALRTDKPVEIREAGIAVKIPGDARLAWNRDALPPEATLADAPASGLAHVGSLRNVFWFTAARGLFFQPSGRVTNLRPIESRGEIAVSDFLGGDDFLGRFPAIEVERRIEPGKTLEGGFTLRLVELARMSEPEKDLTWPRK